MFLYIYQPFFVLKHYLPKNEKTFSIQCVLSIFSIYHRHFLATNVKSFLKILSKIFWSYLIIEISVKELSLTCIIIISMFVFCNIYSVWYFCLAYLPNIPSILLVSIRNPSSVTKPMHFHINIVIRTIVCKTILF